MEGMTRRQYILSRYDCLTFARDVLHLHVDARGRAKSLMGQSHSGSEALVITPEVWYDHKKQVGGTVIDLCAWGMFDGDIGRAMEYLAGDFYTVKNDDWRRRTEEITRHVVTWHEKLLPDDRDYLHSRRITDETITRLQLGSMTMDESEKHLCRRIVIPYFKNGRIVYYISRDRLGFKGISKYMKCPLVKEDDGKTDKEVLYNLPWGLHTLTRKDKEYQATLEDIGINKQEWLIICEGAFDAMSFEQEGYCVLATMGGDFAPSARREVLGWCKRFKNVLLIFDNDTAGTSFTAKMSERLFAHRINFFVGYVPKTFGETDNIKDVSDYYTAGGNLANLIMTAQPGVEMLADNITDSKKLQEFFYRTARYAEKASVLELFTRVKARKDFNPLWLKVVYEDSVKAPAETVIVRELSEQKNMKYIENSGFFEYQHGVWINIPDTQVKGYADELLGRYATNARMTAIMHFAKARQLCDDVMNNQSVVNLQNGVLLPNEGCKFVPHDPSFLSTIQLPFAYDPKAKCDLWRKFIFDVMDGDGNKMQLLQEIGGYVFWPDNGLEKCFFLIGDGGNGKGVFMDTIRDVFGRDNCSALPLSSFGGQFDPIMLQYSLVNFASETRVDLRGNIERIKEVTSGNDIIAAHKGVDAIKFSPRCKLITSCNDFFNTGDITHALMRRMCFVNFKKNIVQMKRADFTLKERLHEELPGILNWCIEGYLRLWRRVQQKTGKSPFTETAEDAEQKKEFMRTTNPVAFFVEENLMDRWNDEVNIRMLYNDFKSWATVTGYKPLSLGAFINRIKRVMREVRPDVSTYTRKGTDYMIFPPVPVGD